MHRGLYTYTTSQVRSSTVLVEISAHSRIDPDSVAVGQVVSHHHEVFDRGDGGPGLGPVAAAPPPLGPAGSRGNNLRSLIAVGL
jgi:hypothetical protein